MTHGIVNVINFREICTANTQLLVNIVILMLRGKWFREREKEENPKKFRMLWLLIHMRARDLRKMGPRKMPLIKCKYFYLFLGRERETKWNFREQWLETLGSSLGEEQESLEAKLIALLNFKFYIKNK